METIADDQDLEMNNYMPKGVYPTHSKNLPAHELAICNINS